MSNFNLPKDYLELKGKIGALFKELNTSDYDRAEAVICGFQVRVWRTRINCRDRVRLGYKNLWESSYHEPRSVLDLVEVLYQYKNS